MSAEPERPIDKLERKFTLPGEDGKMRPGLAVISQEGGINYNTVHSWKRRRGTVPFEHHAAIRALGERLGVEILDSDFLIC